MHFVIVCNHAFMYWSMLLCRVVFGCIPLYVRNVLSPLSINPEVVGSISFRNVGMEPEDYTEQQLTQP